MFGTKFSGSKSTEGLINPKIYSFKTMKTKWHIYLFPDLELNEVIHFIWGGPHKLFFHFNGPPA